MNRGKNFTPSRQPPALLSIKIIFCPYPISHFVIQNQSGIFQWIIKCQSIQGVLRIRSCRKFRFSLVAINAQVRSFLFHVEHIVQTDRQYILCYKLLSDFSSLVFFLARIQEGVRTDIILCDTKRCAVVKKVSVFNG